jgi:hypothetical protein
MRKATIKKAKVWNMLESAAVAIGKGTEETYPDFIDRMERDSSPERVKLAHAMFEFGRYCLHRGDCRGRCCEEGRDNRIDDIREAAYNL